VYDGWPPDVRIPPLHPKLIEGQAGDVPHTNKTIDMTGSQVMHFALHSVELLSPLLTDTMRHHPAWRCWLKHAEMFSVAVQHTHTLSDVARLDGLVVEHSQLFDQVPEYAGLKKPKHHFAQHLAADLFQYGPGRGYWCFGFESFNRVIKHAARRSNMKNEAVSIMQYWSVKAARALIRPLCVFVTAVFT
jgi:hypothetical protein